MTVALEDVLAARARLAPHVAVTPLVHSAGLSAVSGGTVYLKLETAQVTGSFKARGALNALMQAQPAGPIVTASAGNHGRAIAWAAERLGLSATVFTPRRAPRSKIGPIVAHGAELYADSDDYEEAERRALECAARHGATFVSPYNHPHVIAGAGTIALELFEQCSDLDTVLVPVGGGGLISGIALAAKALRPSVRVIGVESKASAAFTAALKAGRVVPIVVGATIADGLGGNVEPGTITWPLIRDYVDRIVTVPEADLRAAVRHLEDIEGVVAEGAGAAATAAILGGALDLTGRRTAVLVSGANR